MENATRDESDVRGELKQIQTMVRPLGKGGGIRLIVISTLMAFLNGSTLYHFFPN